MKVIKITLRIIAVLLAVFSAASCDSSADTADIADTTVYSYLVDELTTGLFGAMAPEITMNQWFLRVTWPSSTYDAWVISQKRFLFKDEDLEKPYAGSDLIDKNAVVYSVGSLNGQGAVIGEMSGTITLTDIPHPATQIHLQNMKWSAGTWWNFIRRINMDDTPLSANTPLNWTLPVYASFIPNLENTFTLVVVPGDSIGSYSVSVPVRKIVSDANENIGSLGTVSIKGVKLSGTLNLTYKGEPAPYVEISADYPVSSSGMLNTTCLYLPGPNAPWSMTIGIDRSNEREIYFYVRGYTEKNGNMIFDRLIIDLNVFIYTTNQDVNNIELNLGELHLD